MVLLHVKRSDKETFLFNIPAQTEVDVALREIVKIQNLRLKIGRLTSAAEGLAEHGPMKPPEQQGLDDDTPLLEDYDEKSGTVAARQAKDRGSNFKPDPTERRTGNAPPDDIAAVITRTVDDAKALVSEKQVQMKVPATSKALEDAINNIKGAVMIAFPMGLPDYDIVRQILEQREVVEGAASMQILEEETTSLWAFNKEMQREKLLSDYVGKNEKTKAVVKLQKKGAGAPQREPVVSEDEQKAMIAFYHKKQQEAEKLELEDDDACLHSKWANPNSLKNAFTGVGDISWKPR
mmetsp:Transcript_32479/g.53713  ORF Transcript_32479/g.53713 Transcript_32479/m.53713 type:complete len:293 (-) Transcript_32479:141-1019(-)|eukprot:CAMPEP_0119341492 /NCGR_PEP_ID=MMETSP1333-20130426/102550_1 /TAXON_ID=418940 /ORGANISM="Scyphosphaera apsteinii, Strain RCC1455" /LENGTH=292 /DNA_ID=CAMNT_0007353473 /DNA_START=37 /DNA_END=915 /DNA_ORIENTATION=-